MYTVGNTIIDPSGRRTDFYIQTSVVIFKTSRWFLGFEALALCYSHFALKQLHFIVFPLRSEHWQFISLQLWVRKLEIYIVPTTPRNTSYLCNFPFALKHLHIPSFPLCFKNICNSCYFHYTSTPCHLFHFLKIKTHFLWKRGTWHTAKCYPTCKEALREHIFKSHAKNYFLNWIFSWFYIEHNFYSFMLNYFKIFSDYHICNRIS
jgi:hypothetical protein